MTSNYLKIPELQINHPRFKSKISPMPSPRISPSKESVFWNSTSGLTLSRRHFEFPQAFNRRKVSFLQEIEKRSRIKGVDSNSEARKEVNFGNYSEAQLWEISKEILSKPAGTRSSAEIKLLIKCTEKVKFFQSIGSEFHEQCCKFMTFEKLGADEQLFEIGSYGTKFYIILTGSVRILANLFSVYEELSPGGRVHQKKEVQLTEVKIAKAGESFGELALLDNKPRAATIITQEETYFAVLEKEYYDQILKETELKKFYDEVNFYQSMDLFSTWTAVTLKYLVYHTEKRKYIRGQKVFRQNDSPDGFYIIRQGEFQMICKVELGTSKQLQANLIKKENSRKIELAIMTEGSFFGEEELIIESSRLTSVYCHSLQGELVFVLKREFHRRLFSDDKVKDYLIEHSELKRQRRLSKIKRTKLIIEMEKSEFQITELDANITKTPYSPLEKSQTLMRESTLNKYNIHGSTILNSSSAENGKSSVLKIDFSRFLIKKSSKTPSSIPFLEKLSEQEQGVTKKDSVMLSSLAHIDHMQNSLWNFENRPGGYNHSPVIGRTISVFPRQESGIKKQFSKSTKQNSNESIEFGKPDQSDQPKLPLKSSTEIRVYPLNSTANIEPSILKPEPAISFQNEPFAVPIPEQSENQDSSPHRFEPFNEYFQNAKPKKTFLKNKSHTPKKQALHSKLFRDSFSLNEFPGIKEIKNNLFSPKNNGTIHISSRSDVLKEITDSFKPREILKLRAYQKFEEMKERFNYFPEAKGLTKLKTLGKFEIPKKIKLMIRDLHRKQKSLGQKACKTQIDTSLSFANCNAIEKNRRTPTGNNEIEKPVRLVVPQKKSKETIKKMLPLKYIASEIQSKTLQNYIFFPKIQGNVKKTKKNFTSCSESSGFFVEGRNRTMTEI